ncbi:hypothetical protein DNK03_00150 [Brucella anthropi]|nr:hypothetical protein DNK03_00150 [Brucella anthropi]
MANKKSAASPPKAIIFMAMIKISGKLHSENREYARSVKTKLGKIAFEMDRSPDVHDGIQPQQDRA